MLRGSRANQLRQLLQEQADHFDEAQESLDIPSSDPRLVLGRGLHTALHEFLKSDVEDFTEVVLGAAVCFMQTYALIIRADHLDRTGEEPCPGCLTVHIGVLLGELGHALGHKVIAHTKDLSDEDDLCANHLH